MILSFKKQFPWGKPMSFKEKILSGQKIHSIREDKKGRWKPGMSIHMAYGVRTKFYDCFCDKHKCKSTQSIKINHYPTGYPMISREVIIDGELFYKLDGFSARGSERMEQLAKNDGFDSVEDFFQWFSRDFKGEIIHWTDFRY